MGAWSDGLGYFWKCGRSPKKMYSFLGTHKVSRVYTVHLIINIGTKWHSITVCTV